MYPLCNYTHTHTQKNTAWGIEKQQLTIQNSVWVLGLVLGLIFVPGTDGAVTGAVWRTVAIILSETVTKDNNGFELNNPVMKMWTPEPHSGVLSVRPHLSLPKILHAAHQRQIETHSETVLEKEWWAAAVELSFGDDGDAVTQQVGLVHVMSGQDHRAACAKVKP